MIEQRDKKKERKTKRLKGIYIQDMPKVTDRDGTSAYRVEPIIKIGKCCRIPIKDSNSTKVSKRAKKGDADLVTSLTEEGSA